MSEARVSKNLKVSQVTHNSKGQFAVNCWAPLAKKENPFEISTRADIDITLDG